MWHLVRSGGDNDNMYAIADDPGETIGLSNDGMKLVHNIRLGDVTEERACSCGFYKFWLNNCCYCCSCVRSCLRTGCDIFLMISFQGDVQRMGEDKSSNALTLQPVYDVGDNDEVDDDADQEQYAAFEMQENWIGRWNLSRNILAERKLIACKFDYTLLLVQGYFSVNDSVSEAGPY